MRRAALPLLFGFLGVGFAVLWAVAVGASPMPSYLAAWMVWAGLPIGALTLLLVLEIGGGVALAGLVPALRLLALGMPLAAVLFIPVLLRLPALYPWLGGATVAAPFGKAWLQPGAFVVRAIVMLLILSALALLFAAERPPGQRRAAALLGLFVLSLVTTLAATDWFMSIDPRLHSGEFGLLVLGLDCAVATAAAILLGAGPVRAGALLLAGLSAAWLYLHFIQYLVVWSADLPPEAAWYLARDHGAGRAIEWVIAIDGAALPVLLLLLPVRLQAIGLPVVAALALLAHMAEALWLVTPAARHRFSLTGPDVLMVLGLGGIALGLALLRRLPPVVAAPRRGLA
jgi:hypothetical protein